MWWNGPFYASHVKMTHSSPQHPKIGGHDGPHKKMIVCSANALIMALALKYKLLGAR
jgi:hypothetical protein